MSEALQAPPVRPAEQPNNEAAGSARRSFSLCQAPKLKRPYSGGFFTDVFASPMSAQRGQINTCRTACSSAMRADLDQSISILQTSQIGEFSVSIERLRVFIQEVLSPEIRRTLAFAKRGGQQILKSSFLSI
jgi:hypothetical protein